MSESAMKFHYRTPQLTPLVAIVFVAAIGCGGPNPRSNLPQGDVTVAISYGGTPVTQGYVDLINVQTGEGGGGPLNDDGVATLVRVVEGSYVLTVNPPLRSIVPGETASVFNSSNIPLLVRKVATSPIEVDVKRGEIAEYQFDLKEIE